MVSVVHVTGPQGGPHRPDRNRVFSQRLRWIPPGPVLPVANVHDLHRTVMRGCCAGSRAWPASNLPVARGTSSLVRATTHEARMSATAPDVDVVVIGAGVAGLGAAHALRTAGRSCVVLEASGRIGGRAWTAHPPELGGVWFDMGAVWLHAAERNPLVPIAQALGHRLLRSDELRQERTF